MEAENKDQNKSVFLDTKGRRRKYFSYLSLTLAATVTIFLTFFVISVLINPFLPQIKLKSVTALPQRSDTALSIPEAPLTRHEQALKLEADKVRAEKLSREEQKVQRLTDRTLRRAARSVTVDQTGVGKPVSIGFYVNWDDSSFSSLQQNLRSLDWVVPEWIRLSGDETAPLTLDIDQKALELIHSDKPDTKVLPLLQNYKNEQWDASAIAKALGSETAKQKLITSLLKVIDEYKFGGIAIDIEEVPAEDQMRLFGFIKDLHAQFQQRGLILAQAVPFDNPDWNYAAYAVETDYLMLMAYDQHWATSEPGPIAGQVWFETVLKKRMSELAPSKTIVCFGNYAYNWTKGTAEAEDVSFQDAVLTAQESLESPST
ncbi:MAG: hypothetical protein IPI64_01375 [Chloracidobacterium sp.]|nr:hypothetical protein [Chloracidobacterium sp.]